MSPAKKRRLAKLVAENVPQYLICKQLKLGRGAVQNFRRRNGATGRKPGNPGQVLTADQESQVLRALQSGEGTRRIAAELGVGEWCIRLVAKKHRFRRGPHHSGYRLPAEEREKIVAAIKSGRTNLISLARRSSCSHTTIKKIAHKVLDCPRFVGGGNGRIAATQSLRYQTASRIRVPMAAAEAERRCVTELRFEPSTSPILSEAQALAAMVKKGVATPDAIRKLILITGADVAAMRAAGVGEADIRRAIAYRWRVLVAFAALVARGENR